MNLFQWSNSIVNENDGSGKFSINTGNLMALIGGKIFKDMSCTHLRGVFGVGAFVGIQSSVRSRILDFSLELEKRLPVSAEIEVGKAELPTVDVSKIAQLTQNIIYGSYISTSGPSTSIAINVSSQEMIKGLSVRLLKTASPRMPRMSWLR